MTETFSCDGCGRAWPRERLKEVFHEEDGREVKEQLCPECLDERIDEADTVYGVPGEEKRRGAYVADRPTDMPSKDVTGRRDE